MKSRSLGVDILKTILAMMIVGLHTGVMVEYGHSLNYFFSSGIFRLAVPIFFLISGYFFCRVNSFGGLKHWGIRLLYLFLFWNTLFILVYLTSSPTIELRKILLFIFVGYHHLWYVQAMFIAGILLYVFKFVFHQSDNRLLLFSMVLYVVGAVLQYMLRFNVLNLGISESHSVHLLYRNGLFFAFPFFCLGYYLKSKNIRGIPLHWFFVSIILFITEVYLCIKFMNPLKGIEMHLALYPLSSILFLYVINTITGTYSTVKIDIGKLSSCVFFIHPLFIVVGKSNNLIGVNLFVFTYVFSLLLAYFVIIPIQRKYLSFIL
ncbi:acyltransferase family protein [Saccharicrinis fermentans]|uniref:Acyltransferase 3 domain-containing protein n=1 Tax=Saccharicrinis fermentans DSM 9555 = JCM 21142 TaxID=869213 RepID=W7Y364_9BACT|nr:acyltransferase family protein [Saccharicrinis fermentans]GAF02033.1 hypothetical protein JCM21142_1659 [Saccharicrinis fermentans DSM 9555 = JCM 21142]